MYLYGLPTRPVDLTDSSILKHRTNHAVNKIDVNVNEYMTQGAGRFVNSANCNFIEDFF